MRCCSCTVHARTASVGIPPRPVEVTSHGSLKEAQPDIAAAVETDSHFTSARTADLRDIQTIFTSARDGERLSQTLTDKDTNTTKHLSLAARLLKKLSKDKKVDPATTDGAVKLTELKRDIRKNLLNGQSPTQGGYDSDAPEIATVHGSVSQLRQNEGLARGRSLVRRTNVRNYEWASPGPRRMSLSASPPRVSASSAGPRRSRSYSALGSVILTPSFSPIRLPSFTQNGSSRRWKLNVMESLRISSPSTSALNVEVGSGSSGKLWNSQGRPATEPFPAFDETPVPILSRPFATSSTSVVAGQKSPTISQKLRLPKKSPNASVHLYSMDISRHLRSTSNYSSAVHLASNGAPSAFDARSRRLSSAGFASDDVPPSWGQVLTGASSSIYSSHPNSTSLSYTDLPKTSKDVPSLDSALPLFGNWSPFGSTYPIEPPSPPHTRLTNLPTNPSTSSLGKESRFKEELDISAPKRNSMLNFLGYGIKKSTDCVEQSDGSCDERIPNADIKRSLTVKNPKDKLESRKNGLGRKRKGAIKHSESNSKAQSPDDIEDRNPTTPLTTGKRLHGRQQGPEQEGPDDLKTTSTAIDSLTTRKDATGLMAKAIKATEAERLQFLLPEHKEQASHAIIRQRSASFCRARPCLTDPPNLVLPGIPVVRSHSDSYLTPEFSTPEFSSEIAPTFSRERYLSVAVDPTECIQPSPTSKASKAASSGRSVTSNASEIPKAPSPSTPISRRSIIATLDDTGEPLGAWSRYPSHTRAYRSGSAGASDSVITRDFAYDINPALIADETGSADEGMARGMIGKKKKRIVTNPTFVKGKEIIRHYGRFFRSTSLEYLRHGHGHRSSVATGGELEHPELELLAGSPPIWIAVPEEDPSSLGDDSTKNEDSMITTVDVVNGGDELMLSADSRTMGVPKLKAVASPTSLDGSSEHKDSKHQPHAKTGLTSSLDLHLSDCSIMDDTTMWSETNQSCMMLPPLNRAGIEDLMMDPKSAGQHDRHKDSMFSQTKKSEVLEQPNMSSRITSGSTHCSSDYVDALSIQRVRVSMSSEVSISNSLPSRMRHGHRKNESVTSIRASSYDLLQMLVEAEERERRKALGLDAVRNQARVGVS